MQVWYEKIAIFELYITISEMIQDTAMVIIECQ